MNQPLYQQIIDYLQAQIAAGILPVGAQLPTEKELSTQFNVSRITSKRALTELENAGIIERTQGKGSFVKEKASPASTTSKKVLFLLPFANDLSVGNFNAGLAPVMNRAGIELFMTSLDFLTDKTIEQLTTEFSGLIYYAATTTAFLDLLFELSLINFPVVVLDKKIHDLPFPTIQSDNFTGGKLATEKLIALGHTNIGYIISSDEYPQSVRQRYLGYLQALKEANLAFHTSITETNLLADESFFTYISDNQLTAFVCDNDLSAIQVMRVSKQHQLDIPQHLSVIGFDDIQAAALVDPPLTTMAQNFQEMGELAGLHLLSLMEDATIEIPDSKIPVTLIERQSTKRRENNE